MNQILAIIQSELSGQLSFAFLFPTIFRLLLAAILGGIIGMERGRNGQAAGMRTHMLVCMGASLVMLTNQFIPGGDAARLGAQVVSGIGFLGAGTIIVDRGQKVRGLTTAAGLWASACMGLAIGIGYYSGAVIACILISAIVIVMNRFERRFLEKSSVMVFYAEFDCAGRIHEFSDLAAEKGIKVLDIHWVPPSDLNGEHSQQIGVQFTVKLPQRISHSVLLHEFKQMQGALAFEKR